MFIMIDGIDGSGKSTIINAWIEYLKNQGKKIFVLKSYWKEHCAHPTFAEIKNFDAVISAEPTAVGIGKKIRDEMIQSGNNYSAKDIAAAYAEDRSILYQKLLIPYLSLGKIVIQDRGVSTSLCYQPIQSPYLSTEYIASLPGNKIATKRAPDHLVIADIEPKKALSRLNTRMDKNDNAIFEKLDFLENARNKFIESGYLDYFKKKGTETHILNTDEKIDIMKITAVELLIKILKQS